MDQGPPDEAVAQYLLKAGMATPDQIQGAMRHQAVRAIAGEMMSLAGALEQQGIITAPQRKTVEKKVASKHRVGRLGSYKLKRKIGEGGMGIVYLARDTRDRKLVALKLLSKAQAREEGAIPRFRREVEAAMRLDHVNIARAFFFGEEQGYRFYVMEYCEGEPLGKRLKREKRLPIEEAIDVVIQVARALRYAHQNGFVHRDIKPENVIVNLDGVAKVLDLGLSKKLGEDDGSYQTMSGVAMGTPHYISPEQARGEREIDGRADIYSLGATFYHLLTGDTPFHGTSSFEVVTKHLTAQIPDPRDLREEIPDDVVHIVRRMMAKRRQDRYRDAGALLADLERLVVGEAPTTQELDPTLSSIAAPVKVPKASPRPRRPLVPVRRRRPRPASMAFAWVSLGAAVLFLLTLLLIGLASRPSAEATPDGVAPPRRGPSPSPASSGMTPSPRAPVLSPEEAREEEAKRELARIRELDRAGILAPAEQRRLHLRLAEEFKDTPTGRLVGALVRDAPESRDPADPVAAPSVPAPPPGPASAPVRPRAAAEPAAPSRRAPPDAAQARDAEGRMRARFAYDPSRTPASDREALARKLLRSSGEAPEDPAGRFALLRDATELAVQAGSLAVAAEAVVLQAELFQVDPFALKLSALGRIRPLPGTPDSSRALGEAFFRLARGAAEAGDFETASAAASKAEPLAQGAEQVGQVRSFRRDAESLRTDSRRAATDPGAAGRYQCLGRGDWERGLPLLAKGPPSPLRTLAEEDLAGAADAAGQARIADGWFELGSEDKNHLARDRILARACAWYELALTGLEGPERARVERRLEVEAARKAPRGEPK